MRYLPLTALGLLISGCVPNPDVLTMREESLSAGARDTVFLRNGQLASQEISALEDGRRVNVWRYYEEGRLAREDVDTNFDGLVDTIKIYDPESAVIIRILRDTNFDGTFDNEVDYDAKGVARPVPGTPVPPARPTTPPVTSSTRPENARRVAPAAVTDVTTTPDQDTFNSTPEPQAPQPSATGSQRPATLNTLFGPGTADNTDTSALDPIGTSESAPPAATTPERPDTTDGTLIQRITPPRRLDSVAPSGTSSGSGIVPDATFRHPSAGLEE